MIKWISPFCFLLSILLLTSMVHPPRLSSEPIPPELYRWKDWVLEDQRERLCPSGHDDPNFHACVWPSVLTLRINATEGSFRLRVRVFSESWLPLPGDIQNWPEDVTVNQIPVPVANRGSVPAIRLQEGNHWVEGKFSFTAMPEMIQVPLEVGLVSLFIDGSPVKHPLLDTQGRLWLQKRTASEKAEDRLNVSIFRLLDDEIPMRITTAVKLEVSGSPREIRLESILPENAIPMSIDSPLPARIDSDHALKVQARPGRWEITVVSRLSGHVEKIGPVTGAHGRETWSFQSRNYLRMVEISGPSQVEPRQTQMPDQWHNFPAFLMEPGDVMNFKVIRRGDPQPAPDRLHLQRTWWLDFDGGGFTIHDNIGGTMSRKWYLAMNPPVSLGRVSVDGQDRLITAHGKDKKPGVELRRGNLDMAADSRLEKSLSSFSAVSWDHDFESVAGTLNLPPGWRLVFAGGPDSVSGTWLKQWTLLDLFLVLLIALAVFKLKNLPWGLLALVTLTLIFHEQGAPRLIWLSLLVPMALMRVVPEGWIKKLMLVWMIGSLVVLLALSIVFIIRQARIGIYPQLEKVYFYPPGIGPPATFQERPLSAPLEKQAGEPHVAGQARMQEESLDAIQETAPSDSAWSDYSSRGKGKYQDFTREKKALMVQDPDALIQTGPGLPDWNWRSHQIRFNGPVDRDQRIQIWLLSPMVNLVLCFARILGLGLLIMAVVNIRALNPGKALKASALTGIVFFLLLTGWSTDCAASEPSAVFPPQELLQELKNRLLKPPDCSPWCADISRMDLTVNSQRLRILLEIHAYAKTAIPLPGSLNSWLPETVLVNGEPADALYRDMNGTVWLLAPEGISAVLLESDTVGTNVIRVPIPLKPPRASVHAEGWEVRGISASGLVEGALQLTRSVRDEEDSEDNENRTLPPYFQVRRVFHLGLSWEITTELERLTPPGVPALLTYPLLDGESVTSEKVREQDGKAMIHVGASERFISFTSTLEISPQISLVASAANTWTETWTLDASPVWHCEISGIPVIHHQDSEGIWRPTWRPWPGERVEIQVTRPEAISGKMATIDGARLTRAPGKRFSKATLDVKIRSSKGARQRITLPERVRLQQVKIDGKSQPITLKDHGVTIPLEPGSHEIQVQWLEPEPMSFFERSSEVDLGMSAVNADVHFQMPRNRWILWAHGPRLGPAVLFYSYLLVVVLAALALGKVRFTPLKTWQWLLLGLGLTQVWPPVALLIVGWFLAMGLRKERLATKSASAFNLVQVGLILWTAAAMAGLYTAVEKGLLGIPDMQIAGNGSNDFNLYWTMDRIEAAMPRPWVVSMNQWVFHGLMLFWALWLAMSLMKWLKWAWQCFNEGGAWKKIRIRKDKPPPLE